MSNKRHRGEASDDDDKENRLEKRLKRLEDRIKGQAKKKHRKHKRSKLYRRLAPPVSFSCVVDDAATKI